MQNQVVKREIKDVNYISGNCISVSNVDSGQSNVNLLGAKSENLPSCAELAET